MSFNHYYQSEPTTLRQLGKRFAERNPTLAPLLGQLGATLMWSACSKVPPFSSGGCGRSSTTSCRS